MDPISVPAGPEYPHRKPSFFVACFFLTLRRTLNKGKSMSIYVLVNTQNELFVLIAQNKKSRT